MAEKKTKKSVKQRTKKPSLNDSIQRRMAELNIDTVTQADRMLSILLELEQKDLKTAERALLFKAAKSAFETAIFRSDDPENWIKAARAAARL